MNKITKHDLSIELIDVLNAFAAQINFMASRLGVPLGDLKIEAVKSSTAYKLQIEKNEKAKRDKEAFEQDKRELKGWMDTYRFGFKDKEAWDAEADAQWDFICKENGSEHDFHHGLEYKEPTFDELNDALKEMYKCMDYENGSMEKELAIHALPIIREKLKAHIDLKTAVE